MNADATRSPPPTRRAPIRPRLAVELLREGCAVDLPLGGGSMRPLFAPGDLVRVRPARAADVAPGEVVIVDLGGPLLCHRLVYRDDTRVITRGDDCFADDPALPAAAVIGRVDIPPSPRALYCAIRALLR
jgi:hypothetical protein